MNLDEKRKFKHIWRIWLPSYKGCTHVTFIEIPLPSLSTLGFLYFPWPLFILLLCFSAPFSSDLPFLGRWGFKLLKGFCVERGRFRLSLYAVDPQRNIRKLNLSWEGIEERYLVPPFLFYKLDKKTFGQESTPSICLLDKWLMLLH